MRFKSKSYIGMLLLVHFEVIQTYFVPLFLCTEGRGRIEGRNGAGRREGRRAVKIRFSVPMAAGSGAELVTGAEGREPGA